MKVSITLLMNCFLVKQLNVFREKTQMEFATKSAALQNVAAATKTSRELIAVIVRVGLKT